jgi:hypothetical protein
MRTDMLTKNEQGKWLPAFPGASRLQILRLERIEPVSANKFYAGMHWSDRKRIADTWHSLTWACAKNQCLEPAINYPVHLVLIADLTPSRMMDATNLFAMAKLVEDALVTGGWIAGDDPDHVGAVTCKPQRSSDKHNHLWMFLVEEE